MDRKAAKRGYAIGTASKKTGVNIETIRYYERIGIMPEPDRTESGNRQYGDADIRRLAFVRRCRELGFGLDEIRTLLRMTDDGGISCAEVYGITTSHLSGIRKKITDLQRMEKVLAKMAAECDRDDVPECPIIDALYEYGE